MPGVELNVKKLDERINIGLWEVRVKDILIQARFYKALKEKPTLKS